MTPIGVTIISPSYRKVGNEAVKRFKKFTGLDVKVIRCSDKEGFDTKLQLDKLCPKQKIIFFDADWMLLRKTDILGLSNAGLWLGVGDPTIHHPDCFPHKDCRDNGLDQHRYINTGFFVCDLSRDDHRQVFIKARRSRKAYLEGKQASHDHTDQFHINKALDGVAMTLLPLSFNFFTFAAREGCCQIPREVIGLHGAGYQASEKWEELQAELKVFGKTFYPMHEGAIRKAYAMSHELQ
jgi:hypothetical protein